VKPTIPTRNPGRGKKGPRVDGARYEAMKAALLAVIPRTREGVTFASLPGLVERKLPRALFEGASIPWYVATVKLDLEARGLIRRVANASPQRLRRT
jgi:hypothetical protein